MLRLILLFGHEEKSNSSFTFSMCVCGRRLIYIWFFFRLKSERHSQTNEQRTNLPSFVDTAKRWSVYDKPPIVVRPCHNHHQNLGSYFHQIYKIWLNNSMHPVAWWGCWYLEKTNSNESDQCVYLSHSEWVYVCTWINFVGNPGKSCHKL